MGGEGGRKYFLRSGLSPNIKRGNKEFRSPRCGVEKGGTIERKKRGFPIQLRIAPRDK